MPRLILVVLALLAPVAGAEQLVDLSLPSTLARPSMPIAQPMRTGLSTCIEAARSLSLFDRGIEASRAAVLDCQRGDYPGGGLGAFSMRSGHVAAQADHCRQF